MAEKKKTVVTADEIADFLKQTGFVFEMRTNEALSRQGYICEIGSAFYDLEGETEREIDTKSTLLVKMGSLGTSQS